MTLVQIAVRLHHFNEHGKQSLLMLLIMAPAQGSRGFVSESSIVFPCMHRQMLPMASR